MEKTIEKPRSKMDENDKKHLKIMLEQANIEFQKKELSKKLQQVQKKADSKKYQSDIKFAEDVNKKLKKISDDLEPLKIREQALNQIREDLPIFILEKIKNDIDELNQLIKTAKRKFRFGSFKSDQYHHYVDRKLETLRLMRNSFFLIQDELNAKASQYRAEIGKTRIRIDQLKIQKSTKEINKEIYNKKMAEYKQNIDSQNVGLKVFEKLLKSI